MPLSRLRIEFFRCLTHVELALDPEQNYFFGSNGAGKTSLLEAIHVLGRGRSFRLRQNKRLIQYDAPGFTVFGEVRHSGRKHKLGITVDSGGRQLRLDGQKGSAMTELAHILPVYVIEPSVHFLIEGGPGERRRFLDWGVFHVEPDYIPAWRRYRRVLGQRNAALRAGQYPESWDRVIATSGMQITQARERYVGGLRDALTGLGEALLGQPLEVKYRPGWRADRTLQDALRQSHQRDRQTGATQVGPHRADLEIRLGARGIREEISRGQQKLAAAALVLAQVRVMAGSKGHGGTLLVDDPAAELDEAALGALLSVLDTLPAQRIITGLTEASLAGPQLPLMFHVEQGRVRPML
ncbi:MAG: DNA replication/repair protein RecF [Rhodospirillaceae bacterium]|nr:DNA replication/repair protein RecF [Rhodospirillaceae bacterium]